MQENPKTSAPPEPLAQSNASDAEATPPRRIRSFVLRTGRVTTGQEKALQQFGSQYLIPYSAALPDWDAGFQRAAPLILEIGFGMGEATAHIASVLPEKNFICCEVHTPGVGALLKRAGEQKLDNIRIVQHDAVEVLQNMIADDSLTGVHIFFPDPWHKKRHTKRRLIQAPLIALLQKKLKTGGYIHAATDWQEYAEQILAVLSENMAMQNSASGYAAKPAYRPLTKFENRGLKLGHGVWDIVFTKK